jgi:uncharacterized protein (DUF1697 family)
VQEPDQEGAFSPVALAGLPTACNRGLMRTASTIAKPRGRATAYVALVRAVNVGGTGKLPMKELVAMCERLGFTEVRTYIASGNVVFASDQSEAKVKRSLEAELQAYAGKVAHVLVRTADELAAIVAANPFPGAPANRVAVFFLDRSPPEDAAAKAKGARDEEIRLGAREIYVSYPSGMGESKLVVPEASEGTARNMNTVAKLAALAKAIGTDVTATRAR